MSKTTKNSNIRGQNDKSRKHGGPEKKKVNYKD